MTIRFLLCLDLEPANVIIAVCRFTARDDRRTFYRVATSLVILKLFFLGDGKVNTQALFYSLGPALVKYLSR